jgi:hypothetical protein
MNYRIAKVEAVRYPVVRVTFDDGYSGDYDLGELIAKGPIFEPLKDRDYFKQVAVGMHGFTFGWNLDDIGNEIDFCPDATRIALETQDVRAMAEEYEQQHRPAAE